MAILNTEERAAAEKRVREALGTGMVGAYSPDGGNAPECSDALLETEREILGAQMYAFAEVWSRPALDLETRCFITLSSLAALTRSEQLAVYVQAALNLGIAPEDILEALMQTGVYAGLPAASTGMDVARDVFTERGLRKPGSDGPMTPKVPMTFEERQASFRRVTSDLGVGLLGLGPNAKPLKMLASGPWSIEAQDLPLEYEIGQFNGQYGYGEIWGRPALGYRTRSFITMAALQAVNENDQLQCHINVALNLGITPEEIHEAMVQTGVYCGVSGWRNASNVARDVFLQRGIVQPRVAAEEFA
ncbi:MAG: carboxymuconolactone decarboxylase family protein [Novosphingobium sp.]|nr:carboxymuconolactone decarboxylase family protein [Novosphingobium sp.]